MNHEIDLHSCNQEEAIGIILSAFKELKDGIKTYLIFITGKGMGVMEETLKQLVDEAGLHWSEINPGKFRVDAP